MSDARKKVIIVGGGISGLTCARELAKYSSQLDVKILEASDRIGGRIQSCRAEDGTVLELGAHYLHGTIDNPLYEFIIEKGIQIKDTPKQDSSSCVACFHKDLHVSEKVKDEAIEFGFEFVENALSDLVKGRYEHLCHNCPSVGVYLSVRFNEVLQRFEQDGNLEMVQALASVLNHNFLGVSEIDGCSSLYQLDLISYKNYTDLQGDLLCRLSEYSKVIEALQADVPGDWILKDHQVIKIDKSTASDEDGINPVFQISCTNEETFDCDIVVVTVSIEVLKKMQETGVFRPALPRLKFDSLKHMQLSNIVKLFFKFLTPISHEVQYFNFFSNEHNILHNHCHHNNGSQAYAKIMSLDRIDDSDWWLLWTHQDLVPELQQLGAVEFLTNVMNYLSETYVEFPKDLRIDPSSPVYKNWSEDFFYQGGYSYFEVGGDSTRDIENLQKPITYGGEGGEGGQIYLLFGGQMTSLKHYSTTHSGYVAGMREAHRIKEILQLQ